MNSMTAQAAQTRAVFPVRDYDLDSTLACGQAFRWRPRAGGVWEGVIDSRWVQLRSDDDGLHAETAVPVQDWSWLRSYLQIDIDLSAILLSFPDDEPMRLAVTACRGLRLLRQDPWECLASFILSSTKQIVQIQQIIELLCERFGQAVTVPPGHAGAYSFPTAERIAACTEGELRACKMGFRAPNLLATAHQLTAGRLQLHGLGTRTAEEARAELLELRGVGNKIANCVLLFACGFQEAFPIDVWVMKALRQLYFPRRQVQLKRLEKFSATHFGPNSGYAQQYLFHYMRVKHSSGRE